MRLCTLRPWHSSYDNWKDIAHEFRSFGENCAIIENTTVAYDELYY